MLDHVDRATEVLVAQLLVLGRDAGRTVVEVADLQILAAQRHHRRGAEAEALGAKNRRLDHVEPGLQAAIGLQPDLVAQAVDAQRLVHFRQAQLPRAPGVADRGDRARRGAAVVAGDRDQIGVGLGHPGGDGADARLGDQLDRDLGARVDLLEIEDQLSQILDRIDVVMRRRRNQRHARHRIAQPRDHVVDLATRQLAALAGLGALGDLDLQHFGVDQIGRRHAEAAGGDLLDLRRADGAVAGRILAAFTGVGAAAGFVHRLRQRLVGFRRQRAQRHAGAVETQ